MLLPDPFRRGEINFLFARSMSYTRRLAFILGYATVGFLIQLFLGPWLGTILSVSIGAAFLLVAAALSLVEGYTNIPKRIPGRREWRGGTRENLEKIVELNRKTKRWDQSFIDVTCVRGALSLILIGGAIAGVAYLLWMSEQDWLMTVWIVDTVVLIVPHWFSGIRRILTNDPLVVKTEQLLAIMALWETVRKDGEVLAPQMEVRTGEAGEIPADAKLVLRSTHADDTFLGLQIQVTLNNVQGKDYPYLYCVLVARHEFDLLKRLEPDPPHRIIAEPKREAEVDIIVIRQYTTKKSGYHTKPAACARIFTYALSETRRLFPTVSQA